MLKIIGSIITIGAIGGFGYLLYLGTPGQQEARGYERAREFIKNADLQGQIERMTCSYDTKATGQSACTLTTKSGIQIFLDCPINITANILGGTSCTELSANIRMGR